ncbi:hypothetical protein [Thiolapillus sp.]
MKAKNMMLGAVAMGAVAGQVNALEGADTPKPLVPEIRAGQQQTEEVPGDLVATCRGGPVKRPLCGGTPVGFVGEQLAVKKTTKKVGGGSSTTKANRLLEIEAIIKTNRVAVKKTTKKICAA